MLLKRVYDHTGTTPVLDYIKTLRVQDRQNFTQKFIDQGIQDGYISFSKGLLTLHAKPKDLHYQVVRTPGYFCCHDNKRLNGEKEAKAYVAANFDGVESPDGGNPAGYRKDNFYACQLMEDINHGG